jgi:CHAT domain-containing protein/Tfp pilus assembly protein PilF
VRIGLVAINLCLIVQTGTCSPESFATQANGPQDKIALSPGAKIERQIAVGEVHTYRVVLTPRQFVRVVVEERDGDLVLELQNSQGETLVEVDNPTPFLNKSRLSFVSPQGGNYLLTVRPRKDAALGSYRLGVDEWRTAEPKDESAVAAEKLMAEGQLLYGQGTAESRRKAIQKYEESLPLWRAASDIRGEAEALSSIGDVYEDLGDNRKALELCEKALLLWRSVGDLSGEANALDQVGIAYWQLNDYQKALEAINRVLSLCRTIGLRRGEAEALNDIAVVYSSLSEYQKALEHYGQSLSLKREIGDRVGEARTLNNMGVAYVSLDEYQKALECYDRALPLRRSTGDRRGESYTLSNIGTVYSALGEYQKALEYEDQALRLGREVGDRGIEANALNDLGKLYDALGDYQKALERYSEALILTQAMSDRRGEANILSDTGSVYQKLSEYKKASDLYNQALSIRRAIGFLAGEAHSLSNLGLVSSALGDSQKALEYYGQGLTLHRAVRNRKGEAMTLFGIARVERDRGNLVEARVRMEAALEIIESLRTKVSAQELRASFLASVRELYDFQIDLLARLDERQHSAGHAAEALMISERSRARSLLETLSEARADIRQGVPAELLERERSFQQQINGKAGRLTRLLGGVHTDEQASGAQKELDSILTDYQQLETQIRTASPRYAALTQPQPLTLEEIQKQVLDPDTLLLEYSLGEERSYLWAVSPTSITSYALPKRAEIEAAARRVYRLVTAPTQAVEAPTRRRALTAKAEAEYAEAAADLSRILLSPVASQLGTKRLLIVSEGALQYTPFGALPAPREPRRGDGVMGRRGDDKPASSFHRVAPFPGRPVESLPLLLEHEVVTAPSASVLAVLRRERAGRQPAPKSIAVLADPVFSSDDPRISRGHTRAHPAPATQSSGRTSEPVRATDIERSAKESGLDGFVRLRFSRQEAEAIAEFAPEQKRLTALDFIASRETAESADLSQYRIVHFATHGLLNSQRPELSGIVLSLVDESGRAQDGFLRLHEIYNLRLNADLVVLSACQTALGKEVRGEGLIGLTRGFMYAGAPRVVASLWRVDDRATAELMRRFYQGMLKEGLRPAAALRAAQVSMLKEKRWSDPHYWAAFTLQGEWR